MLLLLSHYSLLDILCFFKNKFKKLRKKKRCFYFYFAHAPHQMTPRAAICGCLIQALSHKSRHIARLLKNDHDNNAFIYYNVHFRHLVYTQMTCRYVDWIRDTSPNVSTLNNHYHDDFNSITEGFFIAGMIFLQKGILSILRRKTNCFHKLSYQPMLLL